MTGKRSVPGCHRTSCLYLRSSAFTGGDEQLDMPHSGYVVDAAFLANNSGLPRKAGITRNPEPVLSDFSEA